MEKKAGNSIWIKRRPSSVHFLLTIRRTFSAVVALCSVAAFSGETVQRFESFDTDPKWEGFNNRIVGVDMPTINQDFGYSRTTHASNTPGEIGGRMYDSRTQAYYALPFGKPLDFDDKLSASGKLAITDLETRGVAYLGFFNDHVHEWRPWNSLAFRLWEEGPGAQVMVDWSTADWQAAGFESDIIIPPDGEVHTWRLEYSPDATVDLKWKHPELKQYITDQTGNGRPIELQGEQFIFQRMKSDYPDLTREKLRSMLEEARDQGLVVYFQRHGQHRWWLRPNPEDAHGRITFQFDGENTYNIFLDKKKRSAPSSFNRFGLFNIQRYGNSIELWISDLTVNGEKIDLSMDPKWVGKNNRVSYTSLDFHPKQDFGYAQTNWAGKSPGEIGGTFWRTEPNDPHFAWYAVEVGTLTLEDPIKFSGRINYITGMTDAAMFFGYFNKDSHSVKLGKENRPIANRLGLSISDLTRIGWFFEGQIAPAVGGLESYQRLGVFHPTRRPRHFTFEYDPNAGKHGRVTFSLDEKSATLELTAEQRRSGSSFNRFGLANVRRGGNSVTAFFDDMSYTASSGVTLKRHEQKMTEVERPSSGRMY